MKASERYKQTSKPMTFLLLLASLISFSGHAIVPSHHSAITTQIEWVVKSNKNYDQAHSFDADQSVTNRQDQSNRILAYSRWVDSTVKLQGTYQKRPSTSSLIYMRRDYSSEDPDSQLIG